MDIILLSIVLLGYCLGGAQWISFRLRILLLWCTVDIILLRILLVWCTVDIILLSIVLLGYC